LEENVTKAQKFLFKSSQMENNFQVIANRYSVQSLFSQDDSNFCFKFLVSSLSAPGGEKLQTVLLKSQIALIGYTQTFPCGVLSALAHLLGNA
jgi:hypothetical protein